MWAAVQDGDMIFKFIVTSARTRRNVLTIVGAYGMVIRKSTIASSQQCVS